MGKRKTLLDPLPPAKEASLSTYQKALAINLDPATSGAFVETSGVGRRRRGSSRSTPPLLAWRSRSRRTT
jgi:hypothetical protein